MILVDKQLSGLIAGYEHILQAEIELSRRWRGPLLAAYARRRAKYEALLAEHNRVVAEFLSRLRIGIWLSSALLALGLLIFPILWLVSELGDLRGPLICFAPILILGGLTGFAIIAVLWFWHRDRVKPDPPVHPFKSNLLGSLLPFWLAGIKGQLPAEKAYEGASGEYHFIARLQILDASSFVIYRLQQHPGDDVDVTIIGPRGVWVFEVKYLKGTIRWRDGVWTQRKTYRRRSGLPVTEIKDTGEAYDQQWRRMAEAVEETINRRAPETIERIPKVARVRGGIVFTHPQGKYDIPPGCPFNWGVIQFWLNTLRSVPEVPGVDDRAIIELMAALLSRHQEVTGEPVTRSMVDYANEVVRQAEQRIQTWIDEGSSP